MTKTYTNPTKFTDDTYEAAKAMAKIMDAIDRIVILSVIIRLAQMADLGLAVPGFNSWMPVVITLTVAIAIHVLGFIAVAVVAKANGDLF